MGSTPIPSAMSLNPDPEVVEAYASLEEAYKNAAAVGKRMAKDPTMKEDDNPFSTPELVDCWLYGFTWQRKYMRKNPVKEKINWKNDGF